MKLLASAATLIMIMAVSCGGTPATTQTEWDSYKNQIDNWRVQVDGKLVEADILLEAGPAEGDDWPESLQAIGADIDSITFAATTTHPPHELEDFHESFILASDLFTVAGKLLFEFTGVTEEERTALRGQIAAETAIGHSNMISAQVLFDEEDGKRDG